LPLSESLHGFRAALSAIPTVDQIMPEERAAAARTKR